MRNIRFGIEIETIGKSRKRVANAIRDIVGGRVLHVGRDVFDTHEVIADDGRRWRVMADSSLSSACRSRQAEVVSPILHYPDIEPLQRVARAVRGAGARVDPSCCGLHLHVDGASFQPRAVRNLVRIAARHEQHIEQALGIDERRASWCKRINRMFLARLGTNPRSMSDLRDAWYGDRRGRACLNTKYQGINLHSLFTKGTIEYRWGNSTLHAGKIKTYVQFGLALSAKAIKARATSSKRRPFDPATS